jgi:APA family basic amino acid/polyamine antiporter
MGCGYVQKDFYNQYYNLSHKSDFYAILSAIPITLWAFIGIESATIPSGLVHKPSITIPLATMLGVVITAVIYIISTSVILGIISPQVLQYSISPFVDTIEVITGSTAKYFFALCAALSCFGCLHGWTLLQGQIVMAAANDELLPAIFAKTNQEKIPIWGLFITSMLSTMFIIAISYTPLTKQILNLMLLATAASIILYIYTVFAFIKVHIHTKNYRLFCIFASLIAFIYSLWALLSVNVYILIFYGLMLLIGTIFYQRLKGPY